MHRTLVPLGAILRAGRPTSTSSRALSECHVAGGIAIEQRIAEVDSGACDPRRCRDETDFAQPAGSLVAVNQLLDGLDPAVRLHCRECPAIELGIQVFDHRSRKRQRSRKEYPPVRAISAKRREDL